MKKGLFLSIVFFMLSTPVTWAQLNIEAAESLITRIIPDNKNHFIVESLPKTGGQDQFEIGNREGKIVLKGTNAVSIASALRHYLEFCCNEDLSWNRTEIILPENLPAVPEKISRTSPYKYRYYLNYVTYSYTMAWWDWERWEQEIDWMALHGINMPLALTGQDAVWQKVYKDLGFEEEDLEVFFSGPAYSAFNWLGLVDGWGGPLPQSRIDSQKELQKKILERQRELGMKPILPAFNGHVPPGFEEKFPDAELNKITWMGFPETHMLDTNDPMFTEIGKKFIKEQTKIYGTDHFYSADAFIEITPPSDDSIYIKKMSNTMYESMTLADPKATWIMQGWKFHYVSDFWQQTQIKAFMDGVPDEGLIVLDLYSENHPVWNRTDAFYGKPWIWCMVHNFGGKNSLFGRMPQIANNPAEALNDPESGNMVGIGLTMEGLENNPIVYDLLLENVWRDQPIDLNKWVKDYAVNRYGKKNVHAIEAWKILRKSVYDVDAAFGGPQSIITGRPTLNESERYTRTNLDYDPLDLLLAWEHLVEAIPDLASRESFQYDLVDVTRQVMANYANLLQQKYVQALKGSHSTEIEMYSQKFLDIIDDMDKLLSTKEEFLLGKWLEDAKALGTNQEESRLYEKNARNLLTTWGDKDSYLRDYSARQWSGLLKGFHKPRWEKFFEYISERIEKGKEVNVDKFREDIKDWEWEWVRGNELYPDTPQDDPVKIAREMYEKYYDVIYAAY